MAYKDDDCTCNTHYHCGCFDNPYQAADAANWDYYSAETLAQAEQDVKAYQHASSTGAVCGNQRYDGRRCGLAALLVIAIVLMAMSVHVWLPMLLMLLSIIGILVLVLVLWFSLNLIDAALSPFLQKIKSYFEKYFSPKPSGTEAVKGFSSDPVTVQCHTETGIKPFTKPQDMDIEPSIKLMEEWRY